MSENKNNKINKPEDSSNFNKYIRYSSLAFEMAIIIGLGTYGGYKLDKYFAFEKPILTICLSLFAILASLYLVIKQLLNDNK